jgi:hypothetical protein
MLPFSTAYLIFPLASDFHFIRRLERNTNKEYSMQQIYFLKIEKGLKKFQKNKS